MSWGPPSDPDRWRRRGLSISLLFLVFLLLPALLPPLLLLAWGVDLLRRSRLARMRTVLMFSALVVGEVLGVLAAGAVWLRWKMDKDRAGFLRRNYALQRAWNEGLCRALTRLFGMRWTVEGEEALTQGPMLVFVRHVSTADTILPVVQLAVGHGYNLRYVLKWELSADPCLDIVGRRLPNAFVRRGEGATELDKVGQLAEGLDSRDAVVLFPEGTRFSQQARDRRLAELASAEPELLQMARGLRHTLPPKTGGAMALMARAPRVDVVFCAHTGFEGTRRISDLLAGRFIGQEVRVRYWRVPADQIPHGVMAQKRWLMERWAELDRWVDSPR